MKALRYLSIKTITITKKMQLIFYPLKIYQIRSDLLKNDTYPPPYMSHTCAVAMLRIFRIALKLCRCPSQL